MVRSSRSSRPCGARPRRGLAEPAERPRRERERPQRAWSGAEGDCAAGTRSCVGRPLAGCRSHGVRQTMPPGIFGRCGGALRRRGLANGVAERDGLPARGAEAPTLAARRTSDLGREEPAYAARISRNMDAFSCNNGDSGHTTGLLRACICIRGWGGVCMSVTSGMSGSIGVGIGGTCRNGNSIRDDGYASAAFARSRDGAMCRDSPCSGGGMGRSLGRAGRLGRIERHDAGGALWRVWIASTGCRST